MNHGHILSFLGLAHFLVSSLPLRCVQYGLWDTFPYGLVQWDSRFDRDITDNLSSCALALVPSRILGISHPFRTDLSLMMCSTTYLMCSGPLIVPPIYLDDACQLLDVFLHLQDDIRMLYSSSVQYVHTYRDKYVEPPLTTDLNSDQAP